MHPNPLYRGQDMAEALALASARGFGQQIHTSHGANLDAVEQRIDAHRKAKS